MKQLVVRLEQVQEVAHPRGDVVLEELRQVLIVQVVEDARNLDQRAENDLQRSLELKRSKLEILDFGLNRPVV